MVKTASGKEFWPLDLQTLEHVPPPEKKPRFESVGKARKAETLPEKLTAIIERDARAAELERAILFQGFAYASEMIPEIADTPKPLDDAMRWGFGHEAGPFEMWDALGVAEMIPRMEAAGFPPAPWVKKMLENGINSFYQYEGRRKAAVYNAVKGEYEPIPRNPQQIILIEQKDAGKVAAQNPGATLIDLGDGVCCVEFNTKMNAIDQDVMDMLSEAMDRAEAGEFEGIVIGNDDPKAFSAGANLGMVLMAAKMGQWEMLEGVVKHKRYGGLGVFCRYAPVLPDSIRQDSLSQQNNLQMLNAEITFSKSNSAFLKDRQIRNFTIFYGNSSEPVLTEIYEGEKLLFAKYLKTNTLLSKLKFRFQKMPQKFTVKFSGNDSPDFYAMALDADRGVVVDNIPMRGSSGTYFNKMDLSVLKAFYNNIDLGMILLEFGGNVVPFIETEQGVKNYESWFYSQIKTLRRLNPKVPIIVLGVADMSKKEKDQYVSYPHIEAIRDAMKRAAFRAGAAYWDMYEAMGGENSMPEWVNSEPKLATNDYTHYTPRGAKLIGNMFFNALMYEYQLYQN
jgi:lysophospholipase L1-like esterase